MNPPKISATPQRRKASVSYASTPAKRAQPISTPVNVNTVDTANKVVGNLEGTVVLANPQACLDGLPEELVLHAFLHLKMGPLAALSRTSRRCKRIADELLYERVDDFLPSMIQTLASNSKLAKLVKVIVLASWQGWTKLPVEAATKIKALEDCDASTRMLQSAINVRFLKVVCQDEDSDTYREELVRDFGWLQLFRDAAGRTLNAKPSNPFAHLKELHIEGNWKQTVEDIAPVFRLPSLYRLMLSCLLGPFPIDIWEIPESSSSIKILGMDAVFISSAVVTQMLASIKSLKTFRFSYTTQPWRPLGPEDDPRSYWAQSSWAELGDALRRHKSSLMYIYYAEHGVNSWQQEVYPDGRKPGTLGSLKDFSQLKHIAGQIEMLLGLDLGDDELAPILPAGLKHLSLYFAKLPGDAQSLVLRRALLSLTHDVFAEPLKSVQVMIPDDLPIASLRLADAVEALQQLDTKVAIDGLRDTWRRLQLDELRAIEAGEQEEESESEPESEREIEDDSEEDEEE